MTFVLVLSSQQVKSTKLGAPDGTVDVFDICLLSNRIGLYTDRAMVHSSLFVCMYTWYVTEVYKRETGLNLPCIHQKCVVLSI